MTGEKDPLACPVCGKVNLTLDQLASGTGYPAERILQVLRAKQREGLVGFACQECWLQEETKQYREGN